MPKTIKQEHLGIELSEHTKIKFNLQSLTDEDGGKGWGWRDKLLPYNFGLPTFLLIITKQFVVIFYSHLEIICAPIILQNIVFQQINQENNPHLHVYCIATAYDDT